MHDKIITKLSDKRSMQNKDEFTKELRRQGFNEYTHSSGAIAWSVENLAEYSDEWTSKDDENDYE